ncbi:DNA-binding MarR family transcriptional regulator [Methanolinea mesophila]|uniref:hypothetical protein n=1 Tax=Methanolinea mesophila TaxID=547055 RepID=UPI001AE9922F|nr:hypothetical protein [Methanolinea mesophila]MBP1927724.1 DNA-binding MarR family transcriptional regulator [Methanolinea mesophila]
MIYTLNPDERKVLRFFQEEDLPFLAEKVAYEIGYDERDVVRIFKSLAEKDLLITEDMTGELSPYGRDYDLFQDESLRELSIRRETEIVLDALENSPEGTVSRTLLESVDGLTPAEIDAAIDELDGLGYPIRSRVLK